MDSVLYLTIIIVSLILSFFFSGSETAFVSVNKVRVEVWRRRKETGSSLVTNFVRHPERFLYTTLIGNNIFNVAFATFATIYFGNYLDEQWVWLGIVLATLLFGEVIPKTAFRNMADLLVRYIAYPLELFYWVLWPLNWIISHLAGYLLSLFGQRYEARHKLFSSRDIEHLLAESSASMAESRLEDDDMTERTDLLMGILRLKKNRVREAMVPRTEMVAMPETSSIDEISEVFQKYGYTKVPVYRENLDDIIGVVFSRDLLQDPKTFTELVRDVLFVPETKRCSDLLSEFRSNNTSIAIVIDEYGGTAGLVTTEDLVEELFGEIEDEHDEQERLIRKIDEKTYSVNARTEIAKLNETLGLALPEGDYDTLAGFLISLTGNIPRRDTRVEYEGVRFEVTRATRRRVEWVKVLLP